MIILGIIVWLGLLVFVCTLGMAAKRADEAMARMWEEREETQPSANRKEVTQWQLIE